MNHEQKYKDALKRAREYKKHGYMMINTVLDNIFPELKESEDERIRKELIAFIKKRDRSGCDYDYDQWLAWLEKQGNSKYELLPTEEEIHWLEWVIGRIPASSKTNEAESVLTEFLEKLKNMKGGEQ